MDYYDNLDIFSNNNPTQLDDAIVVDGGITSEFRYQKVKLSTPFLLTDNAHGSIPEIMEVYVTCNGDTFHYHLDTATTNTYTYLSDIQFQGKVGKTYKLRILTNKKVITAEDQMVMLENESTFDVLKENTRVTERETTDGLKLAFPQHIFKLGAQPVILIINPVMEYFPDMYIDNANSRTYIHPGQSLQAILSGAGFEYSYSTHGHDSPVEIQTYSVSERYYAYLVSMLNETDWSASIFSTIPGNTLSNVQNGYGYFYATDVAREQVHGIDFLK